MSTAIVLPEVTEVEVGKSYIIHDYFGHFEFITVRSVEVNGEPHLSYGPGGLNGNTSISWMREHGARFYGPCEIAQD